MADGIEADASDLRYLAADLSQAGPRVRPFARKALEVTARHVRDQWRANAVVADPEGFVGAYPSSIFYDVKQSANEIEAEIGPETDRNGGTAGFLEEGTVMRPPQHAGRDALEANEQDFIDGLEAAVMDALGE